MQAVGFAKYFANLTACIFRLFRIILTLHTVSIIPKS